MISVLKQTKGFSLKQILYSFGMVLLIFGIAPTNILAQSEKEAVIVVVQKFFDAMADRDTTAARAIVMPESRYYSMRDDTKQVKVRGSKILNSIQRLAKSKDNLLERMWNPNVLIHGRIATLWTEYDFHRNGKFSHCGVDSFSLIKTPEGWKIAGIIYTVDPSGCKASPLGSLD